MDEDEEEAEGEEEVGDAMALGGNATGLKYISTAAREGSEGSHSIWQGRLWTVLLWETELEDIAIREDIVNSNAQASLGEWRRG